MIEIRVQVVTIRVNHSSKLLSIINHSDALSRALKNPVFPGLRGSIITML
jgi:hypothetical protein